MVSSAIFAQDYEVKPLPFNEKYSDEMAPFFTDSVLWFCSNRRETAFVNYTNQDNKGIFRWYKVSLSNGNWDKPSLLYPLLQNNINNGPLALSFDKQHLAITQNMRRSTASASTTALMGIVTFDRKGEKFNNKKNFTFNNISNYSVGHPTFSADGQTIFFTSDMNKGYGKADIYMSVKKDDVWSEPVNLGKNVNTPGNEIFPFYHSSGKLYFSSDSQGGMGKLDIYYTMQVNGEWMKPVALDTPINSDADDFACFIADNEESGFFTSNRDNSDNIYSFKLLFPEFSVQTPQVTDNYCFTFFEDGPYKSNTIPVIYRWSFGDGQTAKGIEADHCFSGPGQYHVVLNAVDTIQNIDLQTVADYQLDLVKTEQVFINAPDTVKVGQAVTFDAYQTHLPSITPKDYYWDFGDGTKAKSVTLSHVFSKTGTFTISCGTIDVNDKNLKYCSTKEITVTE
jgi:plastocyanin